MIDPQLQAELRKRFNPDGSLLRKHQLRMLEMLKFIHKVCQENKLQYWLSSGTCLGAVRHGGFIPWDDDVDIEMLGKDYDRFCKIMEQQTGSRYILQTHKSDSAFMWQYGKLRDKFSVIKERHKHDLDYKYHGIYIDVFPMDPASPKFINTIGDIFIRLCLVINVHCEISFLRKTIRAINYFATFTVIAPMLKLIRFQSNRLNHRFGITFHKQRKMDDIFPLKSTAFEDCQLCVPNNTDAYLSILYGDYQQLPNIETIHYHTVNVEFLD